MKTPPLKTGLALTLALTALALCTTCRPAEIHSKEEFLQWINDPENGLTLTKQVNGFLLTAKYLPPEYLAYKELEGKMLIKSDFDSLRRFYEKSKTFLLTIGPDKQHPQNEVMFHQVTQKPEYRQRVQDLNFNIGHYLSLNTDKNYLSPVLHHMENLYELAGHRSIYLVFTDEGQSAGDTTPVEPGRWDLKFNDPIFGTGISHFLFRTDALSHLPDIQI